jgi:flagellar motor component MotA
MKKIIGLVVILIVVLICYCLDIMDIPDFIDRDKF